MPFNPSPQGRRISLSIASGYLIVAGKEGCNSIEEYIEKLKTEIIRLEAEIEGLKNDVKKA